MNDEPPALPPNHSFDYVSMEESATFWNVIAALLKQPGQIVYELLEGRAAAVIGILALVAVGSLGLYGLVVGSLAGGAQFWLAPVKIVGGSAIAAIICLPSLFVFLCLNGAHAQLRHVVGLLVASVALMAILLVSLAPIAWIFSQSTDSVALMASLHILLWIVALGFGLRLLSKAALIAWSGASSRLGVWTCIYVLVCLQMMTAVRPIVGTANSFLPQEKQFFLAHWMRVIGGSLSESSSSAR